MLVRVPVGLGRTENKLQAGPFTMTFLVSPARFSPDANHARIAEWCYSLAAWPTDP